MSTPETEETLEKKVYPIIGDKEEFVEFFRERPPLGLLFSMSLVMNFFVIVSLIF